MFKDSAETKSQKDTIKVDDTLNVEIEVQLNDLAPGSPICQWIGKLILESPQMENFTKELHELLELPEEFDICITIADPNRPTELPEITEPQELKTRAQYCPECTAYSWSKGCSSWPW